VFSINLGGLVYDSNYKCILISPDSMGLVFQLNGPMFQFAELPKKGLFHFGPKQTGLRS
jgi:hypothetical protein